MNLLSKALSLVQWLVKSYVRVTYPSVTASEISAHQNTYVYILTKWLLLNLCTFMYLSKCVFISLLFYVSIPFFGWFILFYCPITQSNFRDVAPVHYTKPCPRSTLHCDAASRDPWEKVLAWWQAIPPEKILHCSCMTLIAAATVHVGMKLLDTAADDSCSS